MTQSYETYGPKALPEIIGHLDGKQLDRFHEIRTAQKAGRATDAAQKQGAEIRKAYEQVLREGIQP